MIGGLLSIPPDKPIVSSALGHRCTTRRTENVPGFPAMNAILLTPQQLQSPDAGVQQPTRLVDPRNRAAYVLVSESEYESIWELLEEDQRQRSIRAVALRNAAGWMGDAP
jgi:hypothetical protein